MEPQIANMIVMGSLNCKIDLKKFHQRDCHTWYCPSRFHGMYYHSSAPKATVTIYSSGTILINGVKTFATARKVGLRVCRKIRKFCFPNLKRRNGHVCKGGPHLTDMKIKNVVFNMRWDRPIDITSFCKSYKKAAYYEPELFPACRYTFPEEKYVATIFNSGAIYITGVQDLSLKEDLFERLLKILTPYRK